mgnify:CR=1 FL=1
MLRMGMHTGTLCVPMYNAVGELTIYLSCVKCVTKNYYKYQTLCIILLLLELDL